ncbi:MAG: hypothetical protein WC841_04325 [Candidatus Shapirobacteria bacterium]|jgi:hypothetical protein
MQSIAYFFITTTLAYLFSISPYTHLTPQLIALLAIITLGLSIYKKTLYLNLIGAIVNVIIFTTGGLNSPGFFLVYFLLFISAFRLSPSFTLAYSLIIIIFLSQSLNSASSLIPLLSLLLIDPLAWFVSRQYLEKTTLDRQISQEETDILLWHSLKFKGFIKNTTDSITNLLGSSDLTSSQKVSLTKIKNDLKYISNSSNKVSNYINEDSDRTIDEI